MRPFEITASGHALEVQRGQARELCFTVTSRFDHPLKSRTAVRVDDTMERAWVSVEPEHPRFSAGGTEQLTLRVTVPRHARASEHELKLIVADAEHPDDRWAESAPVTLTVRPEAQEEEVPRERRWWVVPLATIAAGGVVGLLGYGVNAYERSRAGDGLTTVLFVLLWGALLALLGAPTYQAYRAARQRSVLRVGTTMVTALATWTTFALAYFAARGSYWSDVASTTFLFALGTLVAQLIASLIGAFVASRQDERNESASGSS